MVFREIEKLLAQSPDSRFDRRLEVNSDVTLTPRELAPGSSKMGSGFAGLP